MSGHLYILFCLLWPEPAVLAAKASDFNRAVCTGIEDGKGVVRQAGGIAHGPKSQVNDALQDDKPGASFAQGLAGPPRRCGHRADCPGPLFAGCPDSGGCRSG